MSENTLDEYTVIKSERGKYRCPGEKHHELVAVLICRFKITTEKPTGAISGLQHVVDGSIEWSYNLPHSCQLSQYVSTSCVSRVVSVFICFSVCLEGPEGAAGASARWYNGSRPGEVLGF